jgi:hypothetical protein
MKSFWLGFAMERTDMATMRSTPYRTGVVVGGATAPAGYLIAGAAIAAIAFHALR